MNITKRTILAIFITLFIFSGAQSAGATTLSQPVLNVVDTNPDPNIFEAALTAAEQDVTIDGNTVHAMIYKDDNRVGGYAAVEPNGIPIPQIVVNVGDEVIVTLTNSIPMACAAGACDSSIHWHGLELDNDSDGTGVTQNHLTQGQTYTYRFLTHRPGVFWFHTHMLPGPQTFAGMYGSFIVKDPNEAALQADDKIPSEANTHTVVLSDIEFNGAGDVGFIYDDDFDDMTPDVFATWSVLTEECAMGNGNSCQTVASGDTVLVNGQKPTASTPMITAKSGAGIRLRLINPSTNRYFRLAVTGNGSDNNLYRIGGEGGFLEQVRLEGGMLGSWDTKYNVGEILVPASGRADVVIVPTGNNGDIITISGLGYNRSGPSNNETAGDLLYIEIDNTLVDDAFSITAGQDVLGAGGVEDLKSVAVSGFIDPPPVTPPFMGVGSADPVIRLNGIITGQLAIDDTQGHFEDSGPDYTLVPYQNATRYAKTGDTIEFTISNFTGGGGPGQHHPFHHHGFSFQPVRVIDNGPDKEDTSDDTILYTFDYDEFVDVIDVFSGQSIVVRMRLEDRPRITDNRQEMDAPAPNQFFPTGGAEGRWVFHCHLFLHATIGMISELVIVPNNPPVANAGPDQTVECASHTGNLLAMDGSGSMDPDGDDLTYLWTAPGIVFSDPTIENPTATFPLGTTEVTLTVSDGALDDSDTMTVVVEDTTDPMISVTVDPNLLWPPNHEMYDITATVLVTDTCDPNPTFVLKSVTSSEFDDATGDGHTTDDIAGTELGTPDTAFQVRAERDGAKVGRTYTATYTASDASGNDADGSATVVAPHNNN